MYYCTIIITKLRLFSCVRKSCLLFLIVSVLILYAAIESLGSALDNLPHGLQHIVLANCKISNRGGYPRGDNEVLCLLSKQALSMRHNYYECMYNT